MPSSNLCRLLLTRALPLTCLLLVQRRLRVHLSALAGATRSRTLGRAVDPYGDTHQNIKAHGTRHSQPLKKLLNMFRAVYGTRVRMEDKRHGVYSPGVQPDLTHWKGAKDGSRHHLYELKVRVAVLERRR